MFLRGSGGDDESSECGDAYHHDAYARLDLDPENIQYWVMGLRITCRDAANKANCNHNYAETKDDPDAELLANIEASFPEQRDRYRNDYFSLALGNAMLRGVMLTQNIRSYVRRHGAMYQINVSRRYPVAETFFC